MSATIRQKPNSPDIFLDGPNSELTRLYTITGSNDESVVTGLVLSTAPASATVAGVPLTKRTVRVRAETVLAFNAEVKYSFAGKSTDPLQEGESSYQFETAGGVIHINRGIDETVYPPGSDSWEKLIEVNGDEVSGCDIVVPVFSFSETHVLPASSVDAAYKAALYAATGRVNDDSWKGFAAREVLFLGCSGTSRNDDAWQINYRFLASKNETGIQIGAISGIAKGGHDYLWVRFRDDKSDTNEYKVKKIEHVIVNKVYQGHDFASIGIGV